MEISENFIGLQALTMKWLMRSIVVCMWPTLARPLLSSVPTYREGCFFCRDLCSITRACLCVSMREGGLKFAGSLAFAFCMGRLALRHTLMDAAWRLSRAGLPYVSIVCEPRQGNGHTICIRAHPLPPSPSLRAGFHPLHAHPPSEERVRHLPCSPSICMELHPLHAHPPYEERVRHLPCSPSICMATQAGAGARRQTGCPLLNPRSCPWPTGKGWRALAGCRTHQTGAPRGPGLVACTWLRAGDGKQGSGVSWLHVHGYARQAGLVDWRWSTHRPPLAYLTRHSCRGYSREYVHITSSCCPYIYITCTCCWSYVREQAPHDRPGFGTAACHTYRHTAAAPEPRA